MTSERPKCEMRGVVVQGTVTELRNRKLFDAVRERVPPDVQAMMDDPPNPFDWVPTTPWETMLSQIGQVAGRETLREIAHALSSGSGSALAGTAIKAMFKVFGTAPVAVLKRMNNVTHAQFRGVEATYEPETKRSGFVVLRYPEPVNEFVYVGWEGVYRLGKDLTREPDFVVDKTEILDGGKTGRLHIRW